VISAFLPPYLPPPMNHIGSTERSPIPSSHPLSANEKVVFCSLLAALLILLWMTERGRK
jgi:hypothetical protein